MCDSVIQWEFWCGDSPSERAMGNTQLKIAKLMQGEEAEHGACTVTTRNKFVAMSLKNTSTTLNNSGEGKVVYLAAAAAVVTPSTSSATIGGVMSRENCTKFESLCVCVFFLHGIKYMWKNKNTPKFMYLNKNTPKSSKVCVFK